MVKESCDLSIYIMYRPMGRCYLSEFNLPIVRGVVVRIVLLLLLLLLHATVAWALRRRVTRGQPLAVAAQLLLLINGLPSKPR